MSLSSPNKRERNCDTGIDRTPTGTCRDSLEQPQGRDPHSQRISWLRSMYNRISQSGANFADESFTKPSRNSGSHRHSRELDHTSLLDEYDDPPPLSIIHAHRSSRQSGETHTVDTVTNIADTSTQGIPQGNPRRHVEEEASDVLTALPVSKQGPTPPRGATNTLIQSSSTFDRCDSLLARVFPYGSPIMSSTELGSATSGSIHSVGAQARAVKSHLMAHSSVVITAGNDPGRALMNSPVPDQMSVDCMGDTNVDTIAHPEQLLLSVDNISLPPIPSKSTPRGPDHSPKPHKFPRHPDERQLSWSHRRESAGHRVSAASSSRPSSMPFSLPDPYRVTPRNEEQINGGFIPYMVRDGARQIRRGLKPTIGLDPLGQNPSNDKASSLAQGNSSRHRSGCDFVRPSYQDADIFQQAINPTQTPNLTRSAYARSSLNTRNRRPISLPVGNMPQSVTRPLAARSRNGYRSRHYVENANIRQLTVPAPLAPPVLNFDTIPIQHKRYTPYTPRFTEVSPLSTTITSSTSGYQI